MHKTTPSPAPAGARAALIVHNFWAGAGVVGLSLLAGGITSYIDGSGRHPVLYIVAGAALAVIACRRTGRLLGARSMLGPAQTTPRA